MSSSRTLLRGVLLLMLSIGILATPLVLTVGGTGTVRAEQPAMTTSNAISAAARCTSTPGKAAAGQLVSDKRRAAAAGRHHRCHQRVSITGARHWRYTHS